MKPARFEYHRPEEVTEAVELLDRHEEAELMAGNQSLGIMLSTRLATPDRVIDVNRLDDLAGVEVDEDDEEAWIGALTRHRTIERSDALADRLPMLPDAAGQIAGPSVRNRGTLGGSIGEADPAANYPTALVALDGSVHLRSVDGSRSVPARDFHLGYMFTDMAENELITGVSVDLSPWPPARTGMAFEELKRAAQTWPTVSAAAVVRVEADGDTVEAARLAMANAADVPLHVPDAEAAIEGTACEDDALARAAAATREAAAPADEIHADEQLKEDVIGEYAREALATAYDRATR